MKIVFIFEKAYVGSKRILPRDIRNYIASITKDNEDLNKLVMWHDRKQPTFIYSMPNPKSVAIYTFKKDEITAIAIEEILNRIKQTPILTINGCELKIKEAFVTGYEFTKFKSGLFERRLRTPMIIGTCKSEYARARDLSNGRLNIEALKEMVEEKIIESIRFQTRDWFGEEFNLENAIIKFKNLEYCPMKYKEEEHIYYPAVRGIIISNIELPQFIGYKCGMGFGELSTVKEMQRRGK